MTLQEWQAESENLLEKHAGDMLPEFVHGSFWAVLRFAEPLAWKKPQELQNILTRFSNVADAGPFYWLEKQLITDYDGRWYAAMVPTSCTSGYWRFSLDGLVYCRQTFGDDVDKKSGHILNRRSPLHFIHLLLRETAKILAEKGRISLQIGCVGIQGRELYDDKDRLWKLGIAKVSEAESDPIEVDRNEIDGQQTSVAIIEKVTQPLYAAFGYSGMTSQMIHDFLFPKLR